MLCCIRDKCFSIIQKMGKQKSGEGYGMRMKKWVLCFVLTLVFLLLGCQREAENEAADETNSEILVETESKQETETEGADIENLFSNGDFNEDSEGWGLYMESGGSATFQTENGQGILRMEKTGELDYSVQLYYDGFSLYQGDVYQLKITLSATTARQIKVRIQKNGGDYHAYVEETLNITTDPNEYVLDFTMSDQTDKAPRFCVNLGTPSGGGEIAAHDIQIVSASLELIDQSNRVIVEETKMPDININQVAYLPNAKKIAVLRGLAMGDTFYVHAEDGTIVYEGEVLGNGYYEATGERNAKADFSDLTEEGTYYLTSGSISSYPFEIKKDGYQELLMASVKMLYLQRCGQELLESDAGLFSHAACHTSNALIYGTNDTKDVSGGWHDAGDYGRYVSPGAITVQDLFLAYESHSDIFNSEGGDSYGIPESGNGVPDILDEAMYELEWMLKMQDEVSGGVYHKVTCKSFPGFIMPEYETEQLILSPISTTATGAFAAVMAKSAGIYAEIDQEFSIKCLQAATKAWEYLENNPNTGGFHNPADIVTGEYGDAEDSDERFWAAAELLAQTGDETYKSYIENLALESIPQGFGWDNVGTYGSIACLGLKEGSLKEDVMKAIRQIVIQEADTYLEASNTDGYGISLGTDYVWGSNMVVLNRARLMMYANQVEPKEAYVNAAYAHLDYILGNNPMSICYVTGFGSVSAQNPHHRPSVYLKTAMPGMVIGGPDSALQDPCAEQLLKGLAPAKCYVDNDQSYSTNEITIYWNSPLVSLLADLITR